jgi:hypothetical protein
MLCSLKNRLNNERDEYTSPFKASKTVPGTGSGQNSSGVKLQRTRIINERLMEGHTCIIIQINEINAMAT